MSDVLPKMPAMSLQPQWIRCGRVGCRCALGFLHGPYFYLYWRENGRQRKQYVRKHEVMRVRAMLWSMQQERMHARTEAAAYRQAWTAASEQVREAERWTTTQRS